MSSTLRSIALGVADVVGRRPLEIGFAAWFAALALLHVGLGFGWLAP